MKPGDNEQVTDEKYVTEYLESCVAVQSTTLMMTLGLNDPLMPPVLLVARAPGFDFAGIPGMEGGARAAASQYRWGLVRDENDLWAVLALFWPNGDGGEMERRLKIDLKSSVRTFFTDVVMMSSGAGVAEFAISNQTGGMPDQGLVGVEMDIMDDMFRQIASYVHEEGDSAPAG